MSWLTRGLTTSVGLKFLMAISGVMLLLFVLGHMAGNLQVFLGPDYLNSYAKHLQDLGGFLWVIRFGLFAILALHVTTGVFLFFHNRGARPVGYARQVPLASTLASRTMFWSGLALLAFAVYHVLHLTVGTTNPEHMGFTDAEGRHDVYKMVVLGFQQAPITIAYVVAMLLLFLHLWHGASSFFQSLGWNAPKYQAFTKGLGIALALLLLAGNVAMPLCVLFGVIDLPATLPAELPVGGN